jgi:hypothetical protein
MTVQEIIRATNLLSPITVTLKNGATTVGWLTGFGGAGFTIDTGRGEHFFTYYEVESVK